jgi:hypothetical protein
VTRLARVRRTAAHAGAHAAALLAAALLAGCIPDRPWPEAARDPFAAAQADLDSLRAAGRWDEAAARAGERAARYARLAGVPRWRRADAAREAATLRTIAALPARGRDELAAAERAVREGERLTRRDSLSVAEPLLESAVAARQRWLGAGHAETHAASIALARTALWAGHLERAEPLARAAAAALPRLAGEEHPLVAQANEVLGWTLRSSARPEERRAALPFYGRACRILTATSGPASLPGASVFTAIANHYRLDPSATKRDVAALFRHAIALRRVAPGARAEDVASALSALGVLLVQEERWAEAERTLGEALALRRGAGDEARPAGFSMTLTAHGQSLQRLGRNREAIAELREAATLRESLWVRSDRDEGVAMMMNFTTYRELAVALASAGEAEAAFEAFERGNSRRLAERLLGDGLAQADPWSGLLARVQRRLPADAALVFWIRNPMRMRRGDSPMWACVVRDTGPPRWHALPVAPDRGGHFSRDRVGLSVHAVSAWPVRGADTASVRGEARRMGREWFDPLERDLAGVRRLVVTQPDLLSGLPLETLVGADGRWLAERFVISYAPSALLWAGWRERPAERVALADRPALVVGDPARAAGGSPLPALAEARAEIDAIAGRFPHATVLAGGEATADRLRALAAAGGMERFGLIHVAAHSDVSTRLPMRSALLLADRGAGDVESTRLRASEIAARWRLRADLVSLAACWSQAGATTPTDGPFGLEQAFFTAGARSVLVSLWPVDDQATSLFMRRFYENLTRPGAPMPRGEALREARTWLRGWGAADGSRPFAHPCYWAAFVLIGDAG